MRGSWADESGGFGSPGSPALLVRIWESASGCGSWSLHTGRPKPQENQVLEPLPAEGWQSPITTCTANPQTFYGLCIGSKDLTPSGVKVGRAGFVCAGPSRYGLQAVMCQNSEGWMLQKAERLRWYCEVIPGSGLGLTVCPKAQLGMQSGPVAPPMGRGPPILHL